MKIQHSSGHTVDVPRHLHKKVKHLIKQGKHDELSAMFPPSNPPGMTEGPTSQLGGTEFGLGGTIGSILSAVAPIAGSIPGVGTVVGAAASMAGNGLQQLDSGKKWDPAQTIGAGVSGAMGAFGVKGMLGGAKMAEGGNTQGVPINVEGHNVKNTEMAKAKRGELLVKAGQIAKNYISRPPHPLEGQNPQGDDTVQEGMIVIPKDRSQEYINGDMSKRKQIERSIVSQQEDRQRKANFKGDLQANKFISKLVDGGYISPGVFAEGGQIYNAETAGYPTGGEVNNPNNLMKKGGYISYSKPEYSQHRRVLATRMKAAEGVVAEGTKTNSSGSYLDTQPGEYMFNQGSSSSASPLDNAYNNSVVNPSTPWASGDYYRSPNNRYNTITNQNYFQPSTSTSNTTSQVAKEGMSDFDKYNAFQAGSQILPAIGDVMDMTAAVKTPTYRPLGNVTPNLINTRTGQSEINQAYNTGYNKLRDSGVYSRSAQRNLIGDRMQNAGNQAMSIASQNVGIKNQFTGMNADINKYNIEQLNQIDLMKMQGEAKRREARRNLLDRVPNAAGTYMQNKLYSKALGI